MRLVQIDTLRTLLAEKEAHLLHLTEILARQDEADNCMRYAQTIHNAAGCMAGMINSLLVYFRLGSGKDTPAVKPFKLRSIAETLETEFALSAESKQLTFTLSVSDTGTGMTKEQQTRIFTPFERLGNAVTEDGFGLGLAIEPIW